MNEITLKMNGRNPKKADYQGASYHGRMDGRTDGRTDGWTDRQMDRPTNRHGKVLSRVSVTKNIWGTQKAQIPSTQI